MSLERPRSRDALLNRFKNNETGDIGPLDFRDLIVTRFGSYGYLANGGVLGGYDWSISTGSTMAEKGYNQWQPLFKTAAPETIVLDGCYRRLESDENQALTASVAGFYAVTASWYLQAYVDTGTTGTVYLGVRKNGTLLRSFPAGSFTSLYRGGLSWRDTFYLLPGESISIVFEVIADASGSTTPHISVSGAKLAMWRVG